MEQKAVNMTLALRKAWYHEWLGFILVPLGLTVAATVILPSLQRENGLPFSLIFVLIVVEFGHFISPRPFYHEKYWKKTITYDEYILATVKKTLLFSLPMILGSAIVSFFASPCKEAASIFEVYILALLFSVLLYSTLGYIRQIWKTDDDKAVLPLKRQLWRFILPITITSGIATLCGIFNLWTRT